jgi:hypothetical protein
MELVESLLLLFLIIQVINEHWLVTMPNGVESFAAKCQACTDMKEVRTHTCPTKKRKVLPPNARRAPT